MKMTTTLKLAAMAAAAAVVSASAQTAVTTGADGAGLLGQRFSGIEYGYTHHVEAAPRSLNRYGFVSQAPLPEGQNLDGAFRYDYIRGSTAGLRAQTHDVRMALTKYFTHEAAKPFVDVELGWAWQKLGPAKDNAFAYRAGLGAELPVNNQLAVTPFVAFEDASPLAREGLWNYGAKLICRPTQPWSATLTVQVDEKHNIEYALGLQRRY